MVKQNQGFRIDLNLEENTNDTQALSNLGGVGIANDLRIIQNNLRNLSSIPFNNIRDGFFVFDVDKVIPINSIVSTASTTGNSTELEVSLSSSYNIYSPNIVVISGVTGSASTVYNGEFVTTVTTDGGTVHKIEIPDLEYTASASGSDVSGATITFKPKNDFIFTDGDVVNVTKNVNTGSSNLVTSQDYYVCNSDTLTKFQLSTTPPSVGLSTVTVDSVNDSIFLFVRQDRVTQENLLNYIEPEIQDTEDFGGYLAGSINSIFESTQANLETADYFVEQKYKGTDDTSAVRDIKFEGNIKIDDPGSTNYNYSQLSNDKSPGIFINGVRAFSSDNNPWTKDGTTLKTLSEEVTMGELFFGDNITITGINVDSLSQTDVTTFTHKVPIQINEETYYLLLRL